MHDRGIRHHFRDDPRNGSSSLPGHYIEYFTSVVADFSRLPRYYRCPHYRAGIYCGIQWTNGLHVPGWKAISRSSHVSWAHREAQLQNKTFRSFCDIWPLYLSLKPKCGTLVWNESLIRMAKNRILHEFGLNLAWNQILKPKRKIKWFGFIFNCLVTAVYRKYI